MGDSQCGAVGDRRDLGDHVSAVVPPVDAGELGRGDHRGWSRNRDICVDQDQRGAAVHAAVEEDDRACSRQTASRRRSSLAASRRIASGAPSAASCAKRQPILNCSTTSPRSATPSSMAFEPGRCRRVGLHRSRDGRELGDLPERIAVSVVTAACFARIASAELSRGRAGSASTTPRSPPPHCDTTPRSSLRTPISRPSMS